MQFIADSCSVNFPMIAPGNIKCYVTSLGSAVLRVDFMSTDELTEWIEKIHANKQII